MFSFSSAFKIIQSSRFKELSKTGKKHISPYFVLLYKENEFDQARMGITVSKKCSKLAVQRNRLKRIIREAFRHNKDHLKSFDIVVIARKKALDVSHQLLREDLEKLWKKL